MCVLVSVYGLLLWTPRIIATRFVLVFLCLSAGSFWAGILFHAAHNVMIYSFWAVLPDTDGAMWPFARYMHAESGITVAVGYVLAAFLCVRVWKRHDDKFQQLTHPLQASVTPHTRQVHHTQQ